MMNVNIQFHLEPNAELTEEQLQHIHDVMETTRTSLRDMGYVRCAMYVGDETYKLYEKGLIKKDTIELTIDVQRGLGDDDLTKQELRNWMRTCVFRARPQIKIRKMKIHMGGIPVRSKKSGTRRTKDGFTPPPSTEVE